MGIFDIFSNKKAEENVVEENTVIMDKSRLINAISISKGLSKSDVGIALDGFIDVVTKTLKDGKTVVLERFGEFSVTNIPNENNKEERMPVFVASVELINAFNQ